MSDAETTSRRRPTSPAPAQAQLPDDDDLLFEILLRLPPQPSSLPRASLVCKRWRRLVSDPVFLGRFRARHRRPPLLGFFKERLRNPTFTRTLDPPDRIPSSRFSWRLPGDIGDHSRLFGDYYQLFAFRHGRALLYHRRLFRLMVWDPVTGDRRAVDIPGAFHDRRVVVYNGAVRCVDGGQGHVHGGCHSSPFEVAIVGTDKRRTQAFARVYSSETSNWRNVISTAFNFRGYMVCSSTLVGNFLYWLFQGSAIAILQFDLDTQRLAQIDVLPDMHAHDDGCCRIAPAEDGELVFLVLRNFSLNLWKNKTNRDGVVGWVLEKTIQLDKFLSFEPGPDTAAPMILGFSEEHNVVFLGADSGVFMVNLESMQFKILSQTLEVGIYYPFTSFYTKELLPE